MRKRVPVENGQGVTSNTLPYKALRDAAVLRIREAILQGRLKPGQRILEADMAQELGISRAPIREAIRQLESEGLVVSRAHRGTYVTTLSSQDAREIFSLRAALEGLAIMLVAQSRNAEAGRSQEDRQRKGQRRLSCRRPAAGATRPPVSGSRSSTW